MRILKGLNPGARSLVTEDFRKGDPATVDATDFIAALELGRTISIEPIRSVVNLAMERFEFDPWKSDSWLGPRIHATLRLTRREAADKRIWNYLTVMEFPDYVRWRWSPTDEEKTIPINRFIGENTTQSVARLWWAAELTRNGCRYEPAVKALSLSQFFVWQGLNLIHNRAAAIAAVEFLSTFGEMGASNPQTHKLAGAANVALRTVCLDDFAQNPSPDAEAIREWLTEKIDETTMIDELPKGPDEASVPETDIAVVRKFLADLAVSIKLTEVKSGRPSKAELVETL